MNSSQPNIRVFEHDIRPGVGLAALLLGAPEHSVRELLGQPTDVSVEEFGDGRDTRTWKYEALGLSLSFPEEDDHRLGWITTCCERATLNGLRIVGLTEEELLTADFGGLGPPVLEDDFEESGKDYVWDSAGVSCWVAEGAVVSVTLMPLYDETGKTPLWPAELR